MDDLISRQAAIDIVVFECGEWTGLAKEINKQLRRLPSAQLDAVPVVHGRWIPWKYHDGFRCEKCNEPVYNKHNYCPNCGADMRGEQDG